VSKDDKACVHKIKTKSVPHKIKSKEVQTETPVEADPLEETKKFTGKNKV